MKPKMPPERQRELDVNTLILSCLFGMTAVLALLVVLRAVLDAYSGVYGPIFMIVMLALGAGGGAVAWRWRRRADNS